MRVNDQLEECQECLGVFHFVGGEDWACPGCGSVIKVRYWTEEEIERARADAGELAELFDASE